MPRTRKSGPLTPEEAHARLERRRYVCKINQRRYREKQRSREYHMITEVQRLRKDLEDLEIRKRELEAIPRFVLQTKEDVSQSALETVKFYFHLFGNGYTLTKRQEPEFQPHYQENFIRSFMRDDLKFGPGTGIEFFIEQTKRYATFQEFLNLNVHTFTLINGDANALAIRTQGDLLVRITESTVKNIFPEVKKSPLLLNQLLGQIVKYGLLTEFYYDEEGKVERVETTIDFVGGLMPVLQNSIVNVGLVLQNSKIINNCVLGDVELSPVKIEGAISKQDIKFLLS